MTCAPSVAISPPTNNTHGRPAVVTSAPQGHGEQEHRAPVAHAQPRCAVPIARRAPRIPTHTVRVTVSARMPSFLHRPRLLSVVATLLLLAGCQASGPASPTPSPVPPVDHTVRFAGSTLPSKTDTVRAIDVLSARLGTLMVGTFSAGAGDAITFTIPASANAGRPARCQAAPRMQLPCASSGRNSSRLELTWMTDSVRRQAATSDAPPKPTFSAVSLTVRDVKTVWESC